MKRRFGIRCVNAQVSDTNAAIESIRNNLGQTKISKAQRRYAITKYSNSSHRELIHCLQKSARLEENVEEEEFHNIRPKGAAEIVPSRFIIFDEFGKLDVNYEGSQELLKMVEVYRQLASYDRVIHLFEDTVQRNVMINEDLLADMVYVGFKFMKKSVFDSHKLFMLDEATALTKLEEITKEEEEKTRRRRRRRKQVL